MNQSGYLTGGFVCDASAGLGSTGWELRLEELSGREFSRAWATWSIAWAGGDFEREFAFKSFDRVRYPSDPARDIYIQANTWGSGGSSGESRRAATQESVLEELEICADLGVDILQIDDGWQVPPAHNHWDPGDRGWNPHPETHPGGWEPVRTRASELEIKLGLWAAAFPVSLGELKTNFTEGGFLQFKLDFANLKSHASIEALLRKVRDFVLWTSHSSFSKANVSPRRPKRVCVPC